MKARSKQMVRLMVPRTSGEGPNPAPQRGIPAYLKILVALSIAFASAVGGGFVMHRGQVIESFEASTSDVLKEQHQWLIEAERILSRASGNGARYPAIEEIEVLREAVVKTVVKLSQMRAPDSPIREAAAEYRGALESLAGALNQYDGSHHSFEAAASAMQNASNVGGNFRDQVDYYTANFLRKSLSAIWWS